MKNIYYTIVVSIFINLTCFDIQAQSLPTGTPVLEDLYRRKQLLGEINPNISFSIRPLFPTSSFKVDNVFDPDSLVEKDNYFRASPVQFANGKGLVEILPLQWQQQFNSHHPYGWNDGAMIPSKGYQSLASGGIFVKYGPLSIQLRPEYVFAGNNSFQGFAAGRSDGDLARYYLYHNIIDAPEQFGKGSYNKLFLGQSSIRLTFGSISAGISNENIWWGPGKRNSLLMTNNAPGFKHLTVNTVKPIVTPIGSFEMQIIGGKLENSGYMPLSQTTSSTGELLFSPYNMDWRYLSGFNISYNPKWIPGLFIGFIRDFMVYHDNLSGLKDYIPFFTRFQKAGTADVGGTGSDLYPRDQRLSLYSRWLFPKAHAEVYFEYGLNDNSYNFRDFFGSPDHARAYIFGISKLVPITGKADNYIEINAEINQLSQSVDRLVRQSLGFYQHSEVRQGYTHLGQTIGAGTGNGGNLQSLEVSWVKNLKKIGLSIDRYEHDADFYDFAISDLNGQSRRWIDYAIAANGSWNYKNLLFTAKIQGIKSLNYQWSMKDYTPDEYYVPNNDVINFHGELGVAFRF